MPRKSRFTLPGIPQHVIQRGNNREPCFLAEPDYRRYLEDLQATAEKSACRIHAYVLMTNHVHLLVTPMQELGIAEMMQALGRRYVYYINKTYRRTGTLWEGRYKASLVDSDAYLLTCMRYNRAQSGAGRNGESCRGIQVVELRCQCPRPRGCAAHAHPLYTALGKNAAIRQHAYRELFRHHLDSDALHEIRAALNHELVLGRSYFKDKIEAMTERQARLGIPGRPRAEEEEGTYYID